MAQTRVRALLNISVVGQSTLSPDNLHGELLSLKYANPSLAVRTIERNRDVILGVKVRLSRNIAGENDLKALHLAREAADAVKLPVMAHIGDTHTPLKDLLAVLRAGDVITHCFHGREGGILDDKGRVLPEVRAAVGRGVHLDVGHGAGSFSFEVAERAIKQDLLPGTISSDLHQFNIHGPVFDLATTLSKFLHLGLTLEQVIAGSRPTRRRRSASREGWGPCARGPRPTSRCSRSGRGTSRSSTRWASAGSGTGSSARWRRSSRAGSTARRRSRCPGRNDGAAESMHRTTRGRFQYVKAFVDAPDDHGDRVGPPGPPGSG